MWLDALSEQESFGVVLLELLHLILLHSFRRGSRDKQIWAMACDMAANEHIAADMLPSDALTVEKARRLLVWDFQSLKSAEYYYDALLSAAPSGTLPLSFHNHKMEIHFPDEQEMVVNIEEKPDLSEINRQAVECALTEITMQASKEGEVPGPLKEQMSSIYSRIEINWQNVLKQFLTGRGRMQIHKTVKRVSKRFDDLPGTKRRRKMEALVAIDESGSINDEDVLKFYKELRIIKRSVKADIMVTRFDTDCTPAVPLDQFLRMKERVKNGGTDFHPIFKLADQTSVKIVLIFSEADGIMPEAVKQKVLWVLTRKPEKTSVRRNSTIYGIDLCIQNFLSAEESCE